MYEPRLPSVSAGRAGVRRGPPDQQGGSSGKGPRPGLLKVAKTMFFGLIMIGSRRTWEEGGDGARLTTAQIVVGALVSGVVLVVGLLLLVRLVIRLAVS